jgi:hypothetical protein
LHLCVAVTSKNYVQVPKDKKRPRNKLILWPQVRFRFSSLTARLIFRASGGTVSRVCFAPSGHQTTTV